MLDLLKWFAWQSLKIMGAIAIFTGIVLLLIGICHVDGGVSIVIAFAVAVFCIGFCEWYELEKR